MGLSDDLLKADKKAKEEKKDIKAVSNPIEASIAKAAEKAAEELKKLEPIKKAQEEALSKKTHQDLINACYKAADKLKIAPWVLIRAAGWEHFTDNRGALYKGPHIIDIETLDVEQKKALMEEVFGLAGNWEQIKRLIK